MPTASGSISSTGVAPPTPRAPASSPGFAFCTFGAGGPNGGPNVDAQRRYLEYLRKIRDEKTTSATLQTGG